MSVIHNPILRGFNPDPSILRVGDDFFIATSTFEWFPGVQIHHSRDLVNWRVIAHPLRRMSQLDLTGVPDSCGVWAPCLSYDEGLYHLVYSSVKSYDGPWKDTPNYLVTADDPVGDWSDPIFLSSAGFDGSLFHDDDRRKWYLSMVVDHRQDDMFGGIMLQEYDPVRKSLIGASQLITRGSRLGLTEGPHLYKKDGAYYLILAEGGTEYGHAVSVMRASAVAGPYELHPSNPLITSSDDPSLRLQKAGHGSLVETPEGGWYIAFLVGRPLTERGDCILGRETALEEVEWRDGWPYLKEGGRHPRTQVPAPELPLTKPRPVPERDRFEGDRLDLTYQTLRLPIDKDWCRLEPNVGLRVRGRESLSSVRSQSLIARRIQSLRMSAATEISFEPESFQELAGLVFYYNTSHFHYLSVGGRDARGGRDVSVISSDNLRVSRSEPIQLPTSGPVILRGTLNGRDLRFSFSTDGGKTYVEVGGVLDAAILSDDHVREGSDPKPAAFTGCFVGMCCQDLSAGSRWATFHWFEYIEYE